MNRLSLLKLPKKSKRSSKFLTLQKDNGSTRSISREPDLPKLAHPTHSMISARAWLVMDLASRQVLEGKETNTSLQVASLTKIMTFLVCMKLIQRLRLNYLRVSISRNAVSAIGTSARLVQGTWLTIHDLLYGLLLPSGNDAAVVLAQTFGLLIDYQSRNSKFPAKIKQLQKAQSIDMAMYERQKSISRLIELFVREMNSLAHEMQLLNTKFNNPTGLADQDNQYVRLQDSSSAESIAIISAKALQQKKFQEIVNTRRYVGRVYQNESPSSELEPYRTVIWRNTNVLLERGYRGVKTGITKSAGGCLSSLVQRGGAWFIIVVLGSQHNQIQRFKDTQCIRELVLG